LQNEPNGEDLSAQNGMMLALPRCFEPHPMLEFVRAILPKQSQREKLKRAE
jgi:hypothetical protein